MKNQYTVEDYVRAGERAKDYAILAGVAAVAALPFVGLSVREFKTANDFYKTSRLAAEQERSSDRPYEVVQARKAYADVCHSAALKEAGIGTGYLLAAILPVALLWNRFVHHRKLREDRKGRGITQFAPLFEKKE